MNQTHKFCFFSPSFSGQGGYGGGSRPGYGGGHRRPGWGR